MWGVLTQAGVESNQMFSNQMWKVSRINQPNISYWQVHTTSSQIDCDSFLGVAKRDPFWANIHLNTQSLNRTEFQDQVDDISCEGITHMSLDEPQDAVIYMIEQGVPSLNYISLPENSDFVWMMM